MKINLILIKIFVLFIFTNSKLYSQASSAANANNPVISNIEYLGWASTVNEVVNVKNEDSLEIHFYTNSGANTLNNLKMRIGSRSVNVIEHAGVGIQSTGATDITRLRSILHLGNNSVDGIAGWRNWLDIGTFSAKG